MFGARTMTMRAPILAALLVLPFVLFSQWTQLVHPTIERCEDLYFLNADTGWAAGGGAGRILRTHDGGGFWWVVGEFENVYLRSIEFLGDQVGFCGSLDGPLYRSSDGGGTWTDISSQLQQPVPGVCGLARADANTIYGAGLFAGPAYVIRSGDAGITWEHIDFSSQAWCLVDILFLNADTGFVVGGAQTNSLGASIFRTTDGGTTWTEVFTTGSGFEWFWKIQSPDGVHLYASVESAFNTMPRIAVSEDAGATWSLVTLASIPARLQGVGFLTPELGWAGDNLLFSTNNAGQSWSTSFGIPGFNRFHKVNDQLAFAGGYGIFRYGPVDTAIPGTSPLPHVQDRLVVVPVGDGQSIRIDVELHHRSHAGIRIHNELGAVVHEVNGTYLSAGEHSFTVDLSKLAVGVYSASLYTNLGFVTARFVRP